MLQTSSHLSKVCGHSHIKKFWLMQTQNESQANVACDKNGNMASSSCFFTSAPVRSSAIKQGSGVAAGMRSLMAGGSPSRSPDRAMASGVGATQGGVGRGNVTGSAKCASLVTCAESLSPPLQANIIRRSASYTNSGGNPLFEDTDGNEVSKDDGSGDEGETVFKSPLQNKSDLSTTTSGSGSPSGDSHRAESSLNMVENAGLDDARHLQTGEVMSKLRPPGAAPYAEVDLDLNGGFKNNAESPPESPSQVGMSISADSNRSTPLAKQCALGNEACMDVLDCGYLNKTGQSHRKHASEPEVCKSNSRAYGSTLMLSEWDINAGSEAPGDHANNDTDDALADEARNQDLHRWDCSNGRSTLRTCSHCGTTKTPLWRSGPKGPKSLCNACGIRFKKSRRCPSSSEGVDSQVSPQATPNASKFMSRSLKRKLDSAAFSLSSYFEEDEVEIPAEVQAFRQSKRKRWPALSVGRENLGCQGEDATGSSGESCLTWNMHSPLSVSPSQWKVSSQDKKDVVESLSLEKHNPRTQVFAKEEEEAAVLLMALSCGVVNA